MPPKPILKEAEKAELVEKWTRRMSLEYKLRTLEEAVKFARDARELIDEMLETGEMEHPFPAPLNSRLCRRIQEAGIAEVPANYSLDKDGNLVIGAGPRDRRRRGLMSIIDCRRVQEELVVFIENWKDMLKTTGAG